MRALFGAFLAACATAPAAPDNSPDILPKCSAPAGLLAACSAGAWGWVGDARADVPLAGIEVAARHGDTVRAARSGLDGRFALCDLPAGDWDFSITFGDAELSWPIQVGGSARALGIRVDRGPAPVAPAHQGPDPSDPARRLPAAGHDDYRSVSVPVIERCTL